ncbi:hypothetical protein ABBQ38_005419 [Trebouxia sp. C0009 RCD-2024]
MLVHQQAKGITANLAAVGEPACRQEGAVGVGPLRPLLEEEEEEEEEDVSPQHQEVAVGEAGPWLQGVGAEGVDPWFCHLAVGAVVKVELWHLQVCMQAHKID